MPLLAPLYRLRAWGFRLLVEDRLTLYVALAFFATELSTLFWDLPGSHGWENDGIAPRDLFGGIANNLTPGSGHRYPLMHYLLLGVLCLPVLLVAVLSGPLEAETIRERVLGVPAMTGISIIAKLLAITMAVFALLALARLVRRTTNARAARIAALFAATNLSFAFYGRVSNLDVPYLFWTVLALLALCDVSEHGDPASHVRFAVLAAASVATKDQAYASYVLLVPLYAYLCFRSSIGSPPWTRFRPALRALAFGALAYGLFSGAFLNPKGFARRLAELRGPASQDWRSFSPDVPGLGANLKDALAHFPDATWPWPLSVLALAGVAAALVQKGGTPAFAMGRAPRAIAIVAGLSSFVFFTLAVGRSGHRFLLPLGFLLSAYGGVGADRLLAVATGRGALAGLRALVAAGFVWAGLASSAVHLTQLGDARREVVDWLALVPAGTRVETYGHVVYQPHFDTSPEAPYRVIRVGPEPPRSRNPLVGALELEGSPGAARARAADVLVISEGFANAYLAAPASPGRPGKAVVRARQADEATRRFVVEAVEGRLPGYRLSLRARPSLPRWATALGLGPVSIQSTTGLALWVLVREDSPVLREIPQRAQ